MPTKQDPYSGPSQKVIGLFSLFLFTGRPQSLGQLANTFHCSKQTILRMVEQIERSRWLKIDTWMEGRERVYQVRKNGRLPNITLDAEALGKLFLCRDMVWHMLPETYRREVTRALQGASTLLPDFDSSESALASYTEVKPKGLIDYSDKEHLITSLIRAIREHRLCNITYAGPKHKSPRQFAVAPYQLVVFHEGLYLRCRPEAILRDPNSGNDMILAVHRMRAVDLLEKRFTPIVMDKDAQQLAGAFGLTQGEPFRVQVKVAPGAALYVQERIWSDDQKLTRKKDGSLVLSFTTTSEKETVAWVLSFGGEMQLISPAHLRTTLHAAAQELAQNHHNQTKTKTKTKRA